jgi:hypothetical protein
MLKATTFFTLSPKKILVLFAIASMNLSSRNSGVSLSLFASASCITLLYKETRINNHSNSPEVSRNLSRTDLGLSPLVLKPPYFHCSLSVTSYGDQTQLTNGKYKWTAKYSVKC